MDCLEQNMSLIKDIRPGLYNKLEKIFAGKEYSYNNIEETNTKDGNKALVIEKNNTKYRLNSLYKPLKEAEKWASQYEFHNINVCTIMFGMGNCLFIREMLKRLKPDARFTFMSQIYQYLYIS